MERGRGGKGEREGWGDHLPYFPPLASASNTTLGIQAHVLGASPGSLLRLQEDIHVSILAGRRLDAAQLSVSKPDEAISHVQPIRGSGRVQLMATRLRRRVTR